MDIKKILDDDKRFEDLLMEAAHSDEYLRVRDEAERGPHVPESILKDYVDGALDQEDTLEVMEHTTFCRSCSAALMRLRGVTEIPEELLTSESPLPQPVPTEGALASDESFEAFLTQQAVSPDYLAMRMRNETQAPLSEVTLVKYVQEALDKEAFMEVSERIALDSKTASEVDWIRDKALITKDLFGWLESVTQDVEDLFFDMLTPAPEMDLAVMGEPSLETDEQSKNELPVSIDIDKSSDFQISDILSFHVTCKRVGYVWALLGSEEGGPMRWILPCGTDPGSAVEPEKPKHFRIGLHGPPGAYCIKTIWTALPLIDLSLVDQHNRFEVLESIAQFLRKLEKEPVSDWIIFDKQINVSEQR